MISVSPKPTDAGVNLQVRALGGEKLTFTQFKIGNGELKNDAEASTLTDLLNPLISFPITNIDKSEEGFVKLTGTFDNTYITSDFYWRELGLFCKGEDGVEVLYAYANDGLNAGMLKANSTDVVTEQAITLVIAVGEAENITAILSQSVLYLPKSDFEKHLNTKNPHKITKDDIGLDKVLNVEINKEKPTYEIAKNLEEILSGEELGSAFGKIKLLFRKCIEHLSPSTINPHNLKASDVGAASKSHSHSASDITSGILGLPRGGLGADNAADAVKNLNILLPETRTALGLPETATPDDAFKGLFDKLATQNLNKLVIQKICRSTQWYAPKAVNQLFRVFCVGGGGAGGNGSDQFYSTGDYAGGGGGGSGYTAIKDLTITEGTLLSIICGAGGIASDGGTTSFGSYITANGGKKGSDATTTKCGDGGNGGAGGGGGASKYGSSTIVSGNGGDGGQVGGGGGGGKTADKSQPAGTGGDYGWYKTYKSNGMPGPQFYLGLGGTPGVLAKSSGFAFKFPLSTVLFDQSVIKCNDYGTNDDGTLYNVGEGGRGSKGGDANGNTAFSGAGGGGGFCGNGGKGVHGGGGGGGYCGNGGKAHYGGGGGGGFFSNGGDSYSPAYNSNYGGGGGGGFFSDGQNGVFTYGGNGGDGGVLIMYITEEE